MHFNKFASGMAEKSDFYSKSKSTSYKTLMTIDKSGVVYKISSHQNDFKNTATDFIKSCNAELSALIAGVLKRL